MSQKRVPRGWASQQSIGPKWGSTYHCMPLTSDGEYDDLGLLEFCPFCSSSNVHPVFAARISCDGCGKCGDWSDLIGCLSRLQLGYLQYSKYSNDFELVVHATKDLGCLLEEMLDAPRGAHLSAQIDFCSQNFSLSMSTINQMKALVEGMCNMPRFSGWRIERRLPFQVAIINVLTDFDVVMIL